MHLKWALYALLIVFTTIKACKNNSSCQECLKDQTGCVFYQNSKDSICTAEKISSKPYILKVRSMEKCPKLGKMSTTNPELVHTTNSSRPTTPREYPVDQTPSVGGQIHKQPTPGTSAETIRRVVRPPIVKRRFTTPRSTTLPTIEHHFTVSTHKPTRVFRAVEPTHESATKTTSQHILLMVTPTPEPTTKATSKPPMNKYHMRSATSDPKPTTILLQPLNSSMTVDLHSASKDIQLIYYEFTPTTPPTKPEDATKSKTLARYRRSQCKNYVQLRVLSSVYYKHNKPINKQKALKRCIEMLKNT